MPWNRQRRGPRAGNEGKGSARLELFDVGRRKRDDVAHRDGVERTEGEAEGLRHDVSHQGDPHAHAEAPGDEEVEVVQEPGTQAAPDHPTSVAQASSE